MRKEKKNKGKFLLYLLFFILFFVACDDHKNPAKRYGDTAVDTYQNVKKFGAEVSLQRLQESIKAFNAVNGRYPKDIEELENFSGIKLGNDRYQYDPSTGVINYRTDNSKE